MSFDIDDLDPVEFDANYGLLEPQETVLIRSYSDDSDDRLLSEIRPRFIVMYEPNQDFIRRIEVCSSTFCVDYCSLCLSSTVLSKLEPRPCRSRVFHGVSKQLWRAQISSRITTREKRFWEVDKRAWGTCNHSSRYPFSSHLQSMLIPIMEEKRSNVGENLIKTISSRIAGGKQISTTPSQVIVDMREFRSTLPSLLHASKLLVIPATLTVGDYILTPDICVERKSIPDLLSSFNSGRLWVHFLVKTCLEADVVSKLHTVRTNVCTLQEADTSYRIRGK